MKIYLAGQYGRREELRGYAERLKAMGHAVTSLDTFGDAGV
jgi:hypothetical protein